MTEMKSQSLWKNRDFVWLVSGQTISEFGSSISGFAIPWLILNLTNSALQMGLMFAVGFTPYLILSLPAGVWADKFNRKYLMMIADAGRMLFILSVPVASMFHALSIWQLYVVQAGMSALNAVFDAAYVSCLPNVVGRESLQQANSTIQTGMAASQIIGPALAGSMVSLFGAANTVAFNGISFFISVVSLFAIRKSFQAVASDVGGSMLAKIMEGLRYVWHHRLIRTISVYTAVLNLCGSAAQAVLLFRISRELHVAPHWAGVIMTGYSFGTIAGSLVAGQIGKRMKMIDIMKFSLAIQVIPPLIIAFTGIPVLITVASFITGFCGVNWNIQSITLRQSVIPDDMLGRASSSIRMIAWISIPLGSASGGAIGQVMGAPSVFMIEGTVILGLWIWGMVTFFRNADRTLSAEADVQIVSS